MRPDEPMKPPSTSVLAADCPPADARSGAGADTAFQAMLKKRQLNAASADPELTTAPVDPPLE